MATRERKTIKPRPSTAREALHDTIVEVVPNTLPPLEKDNSRASQVSVKDSLLKDYSIDFEDIDTAVIYYFDNVIKPSVIEDGNRIKVPLMWANQERWKTAQMDGGIRDKNGKVLFPVITIKKDVIEKVRDIASKVDGNKVHNYHVFEQKYTKKNIYDNFSVLTNRKPTKSYSVVIVPDYYKITYTCAVWVNQESDLNRILESILFASDSYWGDPKRFSFMARIDNVPITRELVQGDNRKIYAEFNITLNGHVIPDSINKYMASNSGIGYSKAQINFTTEVVSKLQ